MLNLLSARTFEAEVACPGPGELESTLHSIGVPVHRLEFQVTAFRESPLGHLRFLRRVLEIIRMTRAKVVVINLDGHSSLVTVAAVLAGVPLVRFCRFEASRPVRGIDRWSWRRADAVICPSDTVRGQVQAWMPRLGRQKVHRIYDPIRPISPRSSDVELFSATHGLRGVPVIGYVGRLHRGKRIELLIEAFGNLKASIPGARLLIVGNHDSSRAGEAYLRELVEMGCRLGLQDDIVFAGYLSAGEVQVAIAAMSVLVLPSDSESFGMVLAEAWAQRRATVASDGGGSGEITRASGGGLLVEPSTATQLARCIMQVLQDFDLAARLGQRGFEWVAANCTPEVYQSNFVSVLEKFQRGRS